MFYPDTSPSTLNEVAIVSYYMYVNMHLDIVDDYYKDKPMLTAGPPGHPSQQVYNLQGEREYACPSELSFHFAEWASGAHIHQCLEEPFFEHDVSVCEWDYISQFIPLSESDCTHSLRDI